MRGIAGMCISAVVLVAGAIMRYAVTYHGHYFNFSTAGTIFMIAGAVGFVLSTALFFLTRHEESARAAERTAPAPSSTDAAAPAGEAVNEVQTH